MLLLNVEDPLLLLDVGGDEVVQEEEGLGVRSHEDVVVEICKQILIFLILSLYDVMQDRGGGFNSIRYLI